MKRFFQVAAVLVGIVGLGAIILMVNCGPAINVWDRIYQKVKEGEGCGPTSHGCSGSILMICNADHVWEVNTDCADYEPLHTCCAVEGVVGCYTTCGRDGQ
jgi:hypothetical protein